MPTITETVNTGIFPLSSTPQRAYEVFPQGLIELFPTPTSTDDDIQLSPEGNFISTYQAFSMQVSATPVGDEKILSTTVVGPKYCVLEEPLPGSDTTKSLDTELEIKVSPYWAPGLFLEPLVVTTIGVGSSPATISGYYTERNFYDREIVVKYLNAVTKFTSDGFFWAPLDSFPKDLPFDLEKIKIPLPSSVNVNTFYPLSIAAAYKTESETVEPYLQNIGQVIRYKPSDIKKLRFFFDITVVTDKGTYPFTAHMTVQNNQKAAQERLKYMMSRRKKDAVLNTSDTNFELE